MHNYGAEATAVVAGWLRGGERGHVGLSLRQMQLWCVPGVCLPISMSEGFSPPGAIATAMESNDEMCVTGLASVDTPSPWQNSPARGTPPPPVGRARGTFSVKLCWPKVLLNSVAPQNGVRNAAPESTEKLDVSPLPTAVHLQSERAPVDDALPSDVPVQIPSTLSPSDVEVLATVKIHRAWLGLLVDDSILLNLVRERALAASMTSARGLPPLHALEVSFRPAMLGSSFSLSPGVGGAAAMDRHQNRRGDVYHSDPLPYVVGIELPPWVRTLAEIQVYF